MKSLEVFAIICLLIGMFGGIANGTISAVELIFTIVLIIIDAILLISEER